MKPTELLNRVDALLDEIKTAVLATVDDEGKPHMRWMTPVMLKTRPGSLFALTSPSSSKALQAATHPDVEWMIQDRALRTIVNIEGVLHVVDNPSLKAEIIETLGPRLETFWRVNPKEAKFVAIETQITNVRWFQSMKGERKQAEFRKGE